MDRDGDERPRQSPGEDEAEVAPGAHQAHDRHPAQAFVEKFAEGIEIRDGVHDVGQKFDFVALLGDQTAGVNIVGGAVFDRWVAAVACDCFARGDDGLAEGEFDAVELPGDHDAGEKIGDHADGLQFLGEIFFFGGRVEAGGRAYVRIAEGRDDGAQIIGPDAHVAVGDDEEIVLGFGDQASEARDFVVHRITAGAEQQADAALGKIAD